MSANHTLNNSAWLGELPSHWKCKKICSLFVERRVKVSDKDYPPLSVAKIGVVPQLDTAVKTDAGDNRKLVRVGDFVINSRSDRKGSCGVSELDGSVSLINIVLTPRSGWNSRYVHYLLRSQPFSEEYYRNGRGIVEDLWTTRYSEMKSILLPVPPRPEQDQIVRFLDWKVSSINRLINIKREKIIELKSLKRSVVNHVVTHGLNPDVAMKNSGVSWLGKIPVHWEVLALKRMCSMKSGDNLTNLEIIDNDRYKVYGGNGIRGFFHWFNCENECVLIGRQGALCGNVHLVTERVWATDHAVITKAFGTISTKYLYYLLMAMNLNQYGQSTAAQPGISIGVIKNLPACLPPRIEQDQIVTYLEATNENYDKVAQILDAQITALLELKARLISDVVTGKIDVRGIEIPEYEFAEETDLAGESDEQNYENIKEKEE